MTTIYAVERAIEAGAVIAALHPLGAEAGLAVIRDEREADVAAREALLDRAMGSGRFSKSSEILRSGRLPAEGLALVASIDGELAGTVRLWHVRAGDCDALLLGPLAVDARFRCYGLGSALMREAIGRARGFGYEAILLVGDAPYYQPFGFSAAHTVDLEMPGYFDRARFLGLELQAGALGGQSGVLLATGEFASSVSAEELIAA